MIDVCVIGTGVTGALTALSLARAGQSVVMLEAGRDFWARDEAGYRRTLRAGSSWIWHDEQRDRFVARTDLPFDLNTTRVKAVGGSTLRWEGRAQRLQPADFAMASRFGLGVDWPLTYEELEPHYVEAEHLLGVAGPDHAPHAPPRSAGYPMPPHGLDYAVHGPFGPALRSLGIAVDAAPQAVASRPYGNRPPCTAFRTCITTCPSGARYAADQHVREAESTGRVTIISGAQVIGLSTLGHRRVASAQYVDDSGTTRSMPSRTFVLAGGGVEVPRLLLNSATGSHPAGLANSSGLVGRHFMMGTVSLVWGTIDEPTDPFRIGFANAETWDFYRHEDPRTRGNWIMRFGPYGLKPSQIARETLTWGAPLRDAIRTRRPRQLGVWAFHESLPDPGNRVASARWKKDRYGMPVPHIRYRLSAYSRRTSAMVQDTAADILQRAGATDIRRSAGPLFVPVHHMGTTRMGDHPRTSVCDAYGRCHDLDNLFIAGSSLFPTAGCSTPTLTAAALALRTARHLGGAALLAPSIA